MRRSMAFAAVAVWVLACGGGDGGPPGTPGAPPPGGGGGGGGGSYDTPEQLLAAAAPQWKPEGTSSQMGAAQFLAPSGWEVTQYTDGVAARSPGASGGQCEIFVLDPRAAASGEAAQYQQLLQATKGLFPQGTVLQDQYGGADPLRERWRGKTGRGWGYVGLFLSVNGSTWVLPFLADFGGTAVPVVIIEPKSSTEGCVNIVGDFGAGPAAVFHSLSLEGASNTGANTLAANAVGLWFSSDGTTGAQYLFGANGQYIDSSVYGGPVEVTPGDWQNQYATWSGTGRYVLRGDVLGFFPSGASAFSRYARQIQVANTQGGWDDKLCWVAANDGEPYTHCLWRTEE